MRRLFMVEDLEECVGDEMVRLWTELTEFTDVGSSKGKKEMIQDALAFVKV